MEFSTLLSSGLPLYLEGWFHKKHHTTTGTELENCAECLKPVGMFSTQLLLLLRLSSSKLKLVKLKSELKD